VIIMAYLYEAFSSIQGEGIYVGKRQVFLRFAGCPLRCSYCDTKYAREIPTQARIIKAGDEKLVKNPVSPEDILKIVNELKTPDVHSVSLTGGEPLIQADIEEILKVLKNNGYKTFLETAGFPASNIHNVAKYVDIASVDIKLPSHRAYEDPEELIQEEIVCIKELIKAGAEVYVKLVILPETTVEEIISTISDLKSYDLEIVIQPVTIGASIGVSVEHLLMISEKLGEVFNARVRIIPQVHRLLNIR